ncbi:MULTISPECIES: hypothetical protein [unclassified Thioalkalivibrio]|uniref:hypothetical protein n=1 Tax=unclassified Thioalkalivibrio TaxID=2621013 RepID=UPI000377EFAF|nr:MULTISPECIES: hypothetical protein [unclassified Thioalkalivibrio]
MKFKYVNPKAVKGVVANYAPVNPFVFARIIEETLENINQGFVHTEAGAGRFKSDPPSISAALVGVADKLLAHNVSEAKAHPPDFYSGLDFDLVHEASPTVLGTGSHVKTTVKSYFHHTEYAREPSQRRVAFHLVYNDINGTRWSISFPIQVVMKGYPSLNEGYVGYAHGIWLPDPSDTGSGEQHNYIGVTKRGWLRRMAEHFSEIRSGSNKTFHRAWRDYVGRRDVSLTSELIVTHHTFEQIMAWEEEQVDREMSDGTSLNMIPGGFKGMRFLHEHRLTTSNVVSLQEREQAVARYQAQNPRAGIPNLIISELWRKPEYAEQVICGAEGRLSPAQVRSIRELNGLGVPVEKIAQSVGAKNCLQVERVLKGVTYSRIH